VVLISADFLASEFITSKELPPLLWAAKKRLGTHHVGGTVNQLNDEQLNKPLELRRTR